MILLIAAVICVMIASGIIISKITIDNDTNPEYFDDDNNNRRL